MPTRTTDHAANFYVPLPNHPGLAVVCNAPERYTSDLIETLAWRADQWVADQQHLMGCRDVTLHQLKDALRFVKTPERLSNHPLVHCDMLATLPRNGIELAQMLADAIQTLERSDPNNDLEVRGAILRMRYLERMRAKAVIRRLNLSERHFYRLQSSGLEWLMTYLVRRLAVKTPQSFAVSDSHPVHRSS